MVESDPSEKGGICCLVEGLSPGNVAAIPSYLSPDPQTQISPHMTLIHSFFPLLEPRVSGYEQDFVCWAYKRMPGFLTHSHLSLADRIFAYFHRQILCRHLFQSVVLWARDPGM